MSTEGSSDLRAKLGNRIRARRDEMGLNQQEFADLAEVGVNTVIRMERGEFALKRGRTWPKVETALGWPGGYFDDYLAGDADDDLEARYRRETVAPGKLVAIVEDMIYEAFIAAAPDTPLREIDKAKRAAFEVLHRHGIEVAKRHPEASQGTETDS
jgi:transcriptional regulator with XRE-family HTH domain